MPSVARKDILLLFMAIVDVPILLRSDFSRKDAIVFNGHKKVTKGPVVI